MLRLDLVGPCLHIESTNITASKLVALTGFQQKLENYKCFSPLLRLLSESLRCQSLSSEYYVITAITKLKASTTPGTAERRIFSVSVGFLEDGDESSKLPSLLI